MNGLLVNNNFLGLLFWGIMNIFAALIKKSDEGSYE